MEPTYLSWSQSGFYQESIRSLPGVHTLYQESIRSPPGVHQDAWGSVTYRVNPLWTPDGAHISVMELIWILSGVHQESIRSPSGVYQESIHFIRSLSGVHQESIRSIRTLSGPLMESIRMRGGV